MRLAAARDYSFCHSLPVLLAASDISSLSLSLSLSLTHSLTVASEFRRWESSYCPSVPLVPGVLIEGIASNRISLSAQRLDYPSIPELSVGAIPAPVPVYDFLSISAN